MSDPFKSIFTVLSGSMKIYRLNDEGQEQIVGFRMPGDLVGIDAIGTDAYSTSAVALETCFLCEIPYAKFEQFSFTNPALQHEIVIQLSKVIRAERMHGLNLAGTGAEYRVARFLIDIATRLSICRSGPYSFTLSMSRSDIANYLGLAMETVSRTFTQFRDKKLISVRRKYISIPDIGLLEKLLTKGFTDVAVHDMPVLRRTIAASC
jgi:CRP/FNR family transcriptional regulator